jgi:hypothetical protein
MADSYYEAKRRAGLIGEPEEYEASDPKKDPYTGESVED